jgi:hypothetical protein
MAAQRGPRWAQAGLVEKAPGDHHLGRLYYREWAARDDRPAPAELPGPKSLWVGTRDCEPDCRIYDFGGGATISRRKEALIEPARPAGPGRGLGVFTQAGPGVFTRSGLGGCGF